MQNTRSIHKQQMHSSVGKLRKGLTFQPYPFIPIQEQQQPLQVRPFTSNTNVHKPGTPNSWVRSARAATSQTNRQPNLFQQAQTAFNELDTKPSKKYMKIYYLHANYKNIIQNNQYNNKLSALPPRDARNPAILAIVQDKFKGEITLQQINLLICQHSISDKLYVYFSGIQQYNQTQYQDSEWIPYSKCCLSPVFLMLSPTSHKTDIYCCTCTTNLQNPLKSTVSSAFNLRMTTPLSNLGHSVQEQLERQKVSRMIVSGKFRKVNLKNVYMEQPEAYQIDETLQFNQDNAIKKTHEESTILELKDLIDDFF